MDITNLRFAFSFLAALLYCADGLAAPSSLESVVISASPPSAEVAARAHQRFVTTGAFAAIPPSTYVPPLSVGPECLFNWAETNYPQDLAPAGGTSQATGAYYYRSYNSGTFLGVTGGRLFYAGPLSSGSVADLGDLKEWLTKASCQNADLTPPKVTYTSRSDGTVDAAVNTYALVALSEPIDAAVTLANFLTVSAEDGTPVPGQVSYDPAVPALVFTPSQEMVDGRRYMATLSAQTKDLVGNVLGKSHTWRFTVAGNRRDSDPERRLQLTLDGASYRYAIPGSLIAVRTPDGRIWATGSGYADLSRRSPITTDMRFRIGSNTKPMVATAVLQLVDQGKVKLDDPIDNYLANEMKTYMSNYDGNKITVRHLLNHTSGIFNFTTDAAWGNAFISDPVKRYFPQELLIIANNNAKASNAPVFGKMTYSNTNYVLLGLLLRNASGTTYEDAMRLWLTEPLGLAGTYAPRLGELDMIGSYSRGYWEDTETGILYDMTQKDPSTVWSSGDMVSTINDLAAWGAVLGKGSLLSADTQAQRLQYVPMTSTLDYGLGIVRDNRVNLIGHQGGMIGYTSQMYYLPEEDTTVAFFYNRTLSLHDYSDVMTFDALRILWPSRFR